MKLCIVNLGGFDYIVEEIKQNDCKRFYVKLLSQTLLYYYCMLGIEVLGHVHFL